VTAVKMSGVVFWIVKPYEFLGGYQRSSETLVSTCRSTWCHNSEDQHGQGTHILYGVLCEKCRMSSVKTLYHEASCVSDTISERYGHHVTISRYFIAILVC
jgi:hypothetical protein